MMTRPGVCLAQMQPKAIAIIQFKLEGQLADKTSGMGHARTANP